MALSLHPELFHRVMEDVGPVLESADRADNPFDYAIRHMPQWLVDRMFLRQFEEVINFALMGIIERIGIDVQDKKLYARITNQLQNLLGLENWRRRGIITVPLYTLDDRVPLEVVGDWPGEYVSSIEADFAEEFHRIGADPTVH
jgi:hypothetical protein